MEKINKCLETKQPETYRQPGESDVVPEYVTTVGVIILCDNFINKTGWTGWHTNQVPDPIVPPGPYKWKLFSTNIEQIQMEKYRTLETTKDLVRDMSYIAVVWTWMRGE